MKKYTKDRFKEIAAERIQGLFDLAESAFKEDAGLSNRYMAIARNISMKHKVPFTKEQKFRYCKACKNFLVPGINSSSRVTREKLVITCSCGNKRRIPLN